MRVALAHDYLREYGGAERVLEVLHEIYPDAPVYTAYYNPKGLGINASRFASWDIRPSWFQNFPFANRLLSPFRIFATKMFESFDLSEYDLVISSSSATHLAKSVIKNPKALHISYIHTPPRFLYGYTTSFNYKKHWWTKIGGEIINHFMRIIDFQVSQRPDILIANSKNIAERIKKFYRRDSIVIYPPVDIMSFLRPPAVIRTAFRAGKRESITKDSGSKTSGMTDEGKKEYFLSLGRLVRGKGTEIIVEACSKLGLQLKVAGSGPELKNLQLNTKYQAPLTTYNLQAENITFLGEVSDEERIKLLANAKALIVASEDEDFGITSIEAQAVGTPVIAVKAGGYLETVIEGKTGTFFEKATAESLMEALKKFDPSKFKKEDLLKNAQRFSKDRFKKEILQLVEKNLKTTKPT